GTYDDGTGLWTLGGLVVSASETLTLTATVDAGTAGSTITNTATATASDQTDANPANDAASADITILATDIAVTHAVDDATPTVGATITYTIVAANQGPLDAIGVGITDLLPAGVTYQGWWATQGVFDDVAGVWSVGGMAVGVADTLRLTATVDPGTESTVITNTAARTFSLPGDDNSANDAASAAVTVANTIFANVSSQVNRSFVVGDPSTTASPITVTDHASTGTILAADDIRLRIPASLATTWDTSDVTADLSGPAAGKVSGAVTYEDAGRTLVLDVTADFAPGDAVTIGGLALTGFGSPAGPEHLELETGNDGVLASSDDKTLTVLADGPVATRSTAIDVTPDGQEVWVVNPDHSSVSVIAAAGANKNTLLTEITVGREPWGLAMHPTNGEVWVTSSRDDQVYVVDAATKTVVDSIAAGYGTYGVAFNPAGDVALVTATGSDDIFVVDVASHSIVESLADANTIERRPRAIAWRADGQRAFVSHLVTPGGRGLVTAVFASSWTTHNINVDAIVDGGDLNGAPSVLQNIALAPAPADSLLWLPTTLLNADAGALSGTDLTPDNSFHAVVRGINVAPSGVPDLDQTTYYLGESGTPVGGPIAVGFRHGKAYVANLHSGNVTVLTDDVTDPAELAVVPAGRGPVGVAASADADYVYVANWLDRTITVINTVTDAVEATVSTATVEPLTPNELNGKQLFFSSTGVMSSNDQASCASCHAFGGAEARAWDLSQFGSHVRATPDLRGSGATLPHNWAATMDEMADQNRKIIDLAGGAGLLPGGGNPPLGIPNDGISQDMDDIGIFVASLTHRPDTPFLLPGGVPSAAADSGEVLFQDPVVGCASCHSGPLFTDSSLSNLPFLKHDVGTADSLDTEAIGGFDTPSLLGVWDTAPYLHDGRAATLEDVLTIHNPDDLHGQTSQLTAQQIGYLVEYLRVIRAAGSPAAPPTDSPAVGPLVARTFFDTVFPNPFRAETSLRFAVKEDFAKVTIDIYDVAGRRVVTLLNRTMPHGNHIVGWDARNTNGRWVAPGAYFARMRVDGRVTGDRKLTVLR
ncbi:DUF11 domain-containing protein, partial [bacterium]|nr:DUF11 domain-containing protein [bacterium]